MSPNDIIAEVLEILKTFVLMGNYTDKQSDYLLKQIERIEEKNV